MHRTLALGCLLATALPTSVVHPEDAPELAPGKLLVASRDLLDPNFVGTVVLLIDYDHHGAFGVIVNRRSDTLLSSVFKEVEGLAGAPYRLYEGGPVSTEELLFLVRGGAEVPERARRVVADIFVSTNTPLLEKLAAEPGGEQRFRVYSGYAGWGPAQLDREVAAGGWHVVDGEGDIVFHDKTAEIWRALLPRDPARSAGLLPPPGEHDARQHRARPRGL
jgi:putative transcriptional regulator